MLTLGLGLGAGIGLVTLVGIGGLIGVVLCVPVLGVATWLGFRAEPIVEIVAPPAPAPDPGPGPAPEPEPPRLPREVEDIPGLLTMIELPGGMFWMGSDEHDDEKPRHPVTLSAFAMGKFPVTRGLYREVMGSGPDAWRETDDTLPANYIRWFDAVNFCNALSTRLGLEPCYRINEGSVTCHREANGYRLPTEAEWEYAARAGTETQYFFGDDAGRLGEYAWFGENADNRVHPVGKKVANRWGFHDVLGNVWEWCWDCYGPYSDRAVTDPAGPEDGADRPLRGGPFVGRHGNLRSGNRLGRRPWIRGVDIGFRCVRVPRASIDRRES